MVCMMILIVLVLSIFMLGVVTDPVLAYLCLETPFILDTDASAYSLEEVLTQEHKRPERVVAYYSKQLSSLERNYCTI